MDVTQQDIRTNGQTKPPNLLITSLAIMLLLMFNDTLTAEKHKLVQVKRSL